LEDGNLSADKENIMGNVIATIDIAPSPSGLGLTLGSVTGDPNVTASGDTITINPHGGDTDFAFTLVAGQGVMFTGIPSINSESGLGEHATISPFLPLDGGFTFHCTDALPPGTKMPGIVHFTVQGTVHGTATKHDPTLVLNPIGNEPDPPAALTTRAEPG
jgi:hypothetical protein